MGGSLTMLTRHAVTATKVGTGICHRAPVSMVDQLFLYSVILSLSETRSAGRFSCPSDASYLFSASMVLWVFNRVGAESLGDLVETGLG